MNEHDYTEIAYKNGFINGYVQGYTDCKSGKLNAPDGNVVINIKCVVCGKQHSITVPVKGYLLWYTGQALIQDALPELSDDERELLLSNICQRCFDAAFAE